MKLRIDAVHQRAHRHVGFGKEQASHPNVVDQATLFVDYVDHVKCFAVGAVTADVFQRFADRPVWFNRNEIERHHATNALLWIREKRLGYLALLRRQQRQHLHRDIERKFVDELRAIVGRDCVKQCRGLFLAEQSQEPTLRFSIEITECGGGELA